MKTTRTVLFFWMVCSVFSVAAESPLEITVRLSADRTIPAVPVDLQFTVTNRSDAAIRLPSFYVIEATPAKGEPFLLSWSAGPSGTFQPAKDVWLDQTSLGPRQSLTLRLSSWPYPLIDTGALPTERLNIPGVYTLRVAFSDRFDQFIRHDLPRIPASLAEVGPLPDLSVTNSVRLQVEEPSGEDRVVWEKMRQAADGRAVWPRRIEKRLAFARLVWQEHRQSTYAPWASAALYGQSTEANRQIRDEIQRLHPQHPYLEWYDAKAADLHRYEAGSLLAAGAPLAEIMRQVDLAEARLQKTLKTSKNDELIVYARETLQRVAQDRVNLPAHFESLKDSKRWQDLPVTPLVVCGKVTDKETYVVFGYDNPNRYTVTIPIGERNMFVPGDMDRGQGSSFGAGRDEKAFRVKVREGGPLTWQLDGTVLTVEPGKIRRCSDSEP